MVYFALILLGVGLCISALALYSIHPALPFLAVGVGWTCLGWVGYGIEKDKKGGE